MSEERVIKHGTQSAYKRDRCRCEKCNAWNTQSSRDYREKKRGKPARVYKKIAEHGTRARYVGSKNRPGCRCEDCTAANRDYQRGWMRIMRDGTGMVPDWERDEGR